MELSRDGVEMPKTDVHIRFMIRRDMDRVLEIDNASHEPGWTEKDFMAALRQRNYVGRVAEYNGNDERLHGKVAGLIVYELEKKKIHVINIAVAPDFRRQGVASQIIDNLKRSIGGTRSQIYANVLDTNFAAQKFYQKQGFSATGVDRNFFDGDRDAYLMSFDKSTRRGKMPHPNRIKGWVNG